MRRFRFRLETVLNYRETIEELREQEFAIAQGHLNAIEARLTALQAEFRRTVAERPGGKQGTRLDAQAILDRERYLETILAAIAQQELRADAARVQAEEKRQALVAARQAREAVSHLRDKELSLHTALGHKLAQEALDELATLQHARALAESHSDTDLFDESQKEAA